MLSERPEQWFQKNRYRRSLVGETFQPFRIGWDDNSKYTPTFINREEASNTAENQKIVADAKAAGKIVIDHAVDFLTKAIPKVWRASNPEKLLMQPDCTTRMDWGHLTDYQGEGEAICKTSNPSAPNIVFKTNCYSIKNGIPSQLLGPRMYCDGEDPAQITWKSLTISGVDYSKINFKLKSYTFPTSLSGGTQAAPNGGFLQIYPTIKQMYICDSADSENKDIICETVEGTFPSLVQDLSSSNVACSDGSGATSNICQTFTDTQFEIRVALPYAEKSELIIEFADVHSTFGEKRKVTLLR